jgi:hypothetical protein
MTGEASQTRRSIMRNPFAPVIPIALALIAVSALLYNWWTRGGQDALYEMQPAQVGALLDETDLPAMVLDDKDMTARHWRVDAKTTMWALEGAGNVEQLRLSATTIADAKGTRIHIDVLPPAGPLHDEVVQSLKHNRVFRDLYRSALAEQIDARLTNREFSANRVSVAATGVRPSVLAQVRKAMDNEAKEYDRREQETIDRAYENEK